MSGRGRVGSLVGTILVLVLAGACSSGGGSSEARLSADGRTEVAGSGNQWKPVSGSVKLGSGQQVRVLQGGATIKLSDDRELQLRQGTQLKLDSVSGSVRPELMGGGLLVAAPRSSLGVTAGDASVTVNGTARLTRGDSLDVGTYTGTAEIDSSGTKLQVPALHQATVPAPGPLPGSAAPLSYTAGDVWDERYLGDAIQLGDELAARSRGFTAQLPAGVSPDADFYRQLIPALASQPEIDAVVASSDRPAGEKLVGLAITAAGTKATFGERLDQVFSFHDEGATWGLVALAQGVSRVDVLAEVDAAIGRGPTLLAESPSQSSSAGSSKSSSASQSAASAGASSSSSSSSTSAGSSSSSESAAGETGSTSQSTTPLPAEGPLRSGVPVVDNAVNNLVDLLSGLLQALGR